MPTAPACRFCCQALDATALDSGRTHCLRSACRAEAQAELQARQQHGVAQHTQALAALLPGATGQPVLLQLQAVPDTLVPLAAHERDELVARWQQAWLHGVALQAEGADSATTLPVAAQALCAHCGGACCANGAAQAGFVDHALLQAWLDAHPGQGLPDAIAAYLQHLPPLHVAGQCAFQAATGCTLPRTLRSATCNAYRCQALQTLGEQLALLPQATAVVLTWDGPQLQSAGTFCAGLFTPLPDLPDPPRLPSDPS